ncbi:MAG: LytTR family DNA-binding domain-containing protein, partial [Bacteroidota bacterium]
PFSFERFLKAMNKVIDYKKTNLNSSTNETKERLFLKGDKKIHQIHFDDILFVEAYGNYSKINLVAEMIVSHEKISALEKLLSTPNFLRVHKSFIVAINKIKVVEGNQITIGEHKIPIGQTYRLHLKGLFNNK